MAITKTDFINYTRCKRYVALENIEKEKLLADVTIEDYKEAEKQSKLEELLEAMGTEITSKNKQLE